MSQQFRPLPPSGTGVADPSRPIAQQTSDVRGAFMTRVYLYLLAGIAAFVGIEYLLFAYGMAEAIAEFVSQTSWLIILGGFMVATWLSSRMATAATSPGKAWGGYLLLVFTWALVFATPLWIAADTPALEGTITTAAWISLGAFAGLSGVAIVTGKDFSFLRGILGWAGVLAICLIVGSTIFGMQLGTWFAVAMIGVAGGAILYDTQKIYRSFPPGSEVVAALHLFSSLGLLFWYVLQILMRR